MERLLKRRGELLQAREKAIDKSLYEVELKLNQEKLLEFKQLFIQLGYTEEDFIQSFLWIAPVKHPSNGSQSS